MAIKFNKKTVYVIGTALLALGGVAAAFHFSGQEVAQREAPVGENGGTVYASLQRPFDPKINSWLCKEYRAGCTTFSYDP